MLENLFEFFNQQIHTTQTQLGINQSNKYNLAWAAIACHYLKSLGVAAGFREENAALQ